MDVGVGELVERRVASGVGAGVGERAPRGAEDGVACSDGPATLIVTEMVAGLPVTGWFVVGLVALIMMLVVKLLPPVIPAASTLTVRVVLPPAVTLLPEVGDSETKDGAPPASFAFQFTGIPPVFLIVIGCDELCPLSTLMARLLGAISSAGGALMASETFTC